MTVQIGNVVLRPQQCDDCGKIAELRPYGPGGSMVCFECGMKETTRRFRAALFAPTPTPREVLARWSRNWYYKAVSPTSPDAPSAFEAEYHAALAATGDDPLSKEEINKLYTASWFIEPVDAGNAFRRILTAYTTLSAQLKAIRENESLYRMENDQFRTKIAELQAKLDAAENTKLATEVMKETLKRIGDGW